MRIALILIVIAGTALAGCGREGGGDARPTVVAGTGVIAAIVEEVAGDDAEVVQLIPDSASPHDFALSAKDRLELEEADLVAVNGAGLEAGLPLDEVDAPAWELAEHVGPLLDAGVSHADEGEPEESEEHPQEERAGDPHVWMDPTRTARAIPSLAEALGRVDPEHAPAYERRGRELVTRLSALDRGISTRLEAVPAASRLLVTNHDALGYFADRYELEIVATVFGVSGPEAEPSARDLADLREAVRRTGVPAVFAEQSENPVALNRVADEEGIAVVYELLVESPGDSGSYEAMLRRDAALIAAALTP